MAQEWLAQVGLLAGVRRIAIDELSYRKHHKYVTAVFDLDCKRLIRMAKGRRKETVDAFFEDLGEARSREVEVVSADAEQWIDIVVRKRTPQATRCMGPFHVVKWATDAANKVRREVWNGTSPRSRTGARSTFESFNEWPSAFEMCRPSSASPCSNSVGCAPRYQAGDDPCERHKSPDFVDSESAAPGLSDFAIHSRPCAFSGGVCAVGSVDWSA